MRQKKEWYVIWFLSKFLAEYTTYCEIRIVNQESIA